MYSLFLLAFVPLTYGQLHSAAKNAGLLFFGTATDNPELTDSAYVTQLSNLTEFGQITPGNSMKWDAIEPAPGNFTFAAGDVIANLAKKNKQLIRCHNLVWHEQLPSWVNTTQWTKESLTAALQLHVKTEVSHYKGDCYSWDVVNEALNDDGTFGQDVFFNMLGEDYIKIAFEAAAAADPGAKLYYNDFGIEFPGNKSTAALNIVKSLKAAGVKIDGVGFQSHFIVGETPSIATQLKNMGAFTALGVEVAITELDIRMTLPPTQANIIQQQKDYETATAGCLALKGCVGVTVWDFDDAFSWVPSTFPGTGSACIFDANLIRKPAYFGALAGLTGTTPQPPSNSTNTTTPFPPNNVTGPTSPPSQPTFIGSGLSSHIASKLLWPLMLVAVLFV